MGGQGELHVIPLPALSLRSIAWIAGGVALALLLAWVVRIDHLRASHLTSLKAERSAHAQTKANYASAQREAEAKAIAAKIKTEKRYVQVAQTADARFDDLRRQYADSLRTKAAGGAGGRTPAPAQGSGASVPQEVPAPDGIVLSPAEAMKLADLQAYADSAYSWAQSLEEPR